MSDMTWSSAEELDEMKFDQLGDLLTLAGVSADDLGLLKSKEMRRDKVRELSVLPQASPAAAAAPEIPAVPVVPRGFLRVRVLKAGDDKISTGELIAGSSYKRSRYKRGEEFNVPEETALDLEARGYAETV